MHDQSLGVEINHFLSCTDPGTRKFRCNTRCYLFIFHGSLYSIHQLWPWTDTIQITAATRAIFDVSVNFRLEDEDNAYLFSTAARLSLSL